jgi:hypothetical protein
MNTQTYGYADTKKPAFSLERLVAMLFAVELRESLDKDTAGDKSDAAYTWGL